VSDEELARLLPNLKTPVVRSATLPVAVFESRPFVDRPIMTQALIANMLGVRREGITSCRHTVASAGYISYVRSDILDRKGLESGICEC
jgi:hypothetical protein